MATDCRIHPERPFGSGLDASFLDELPQRLIGEKAYDSNGLDRRLQAAGRTRRGVDRSSPRQPKQSPTQDGHRLRRYSRRWKMERLFAWLQNFRRPVVRHEYHSGNFLSMVKLGCMVIPLGRVWG